jgi:hypothetical protein
MGIEMRFAFSMRGKPAIRSQSRIWILRAGLCRILTQACLEFF